jgi:hypothetical protein
MVLMCREMPQECWLMLYQCINVVGRAHGALRAEVLWPNFITWGISLRRDGVYVDNSTVRSVQNEFFCWGWIREQQVQYRTTFHQHVWLLLYKTISLFPDTWCSSYTDHPWNVFPLLHLWAQSPKAFLLISKFQHKRGWLPAKKQECLCW